jgi:hypothetical protein
MLRLFLSIDIAGATAYKAKFTNRRDVGWLRVFETFFQVFPIVLIGEVALEFFDEAALPTLELWKVLGDEMIFTSEPQSVRETALLLRALFRAMARYEREQFGDFELHLKASSWLAAFPVPNIEVEIPELSKSDGVRYVDYLGPDIDLGFRIGGFAQPSAIVVSVDLLDALLAAEAGFEFFLGDDEALKGVNFGLPYPIVWARPAGEALRIEDRSGLYRRIAAAVAAGPAAPEALRLVIETIRGNQP